VSDSRTGAGSGAYPIFTTRLAFVFAAVGAAVGLGNIWRFPFEAGENGGAVFVFVYLLGIVAIAFPVFLCEMLIGRRGRASPPEALARQAGRRPGFWRGIGIAGVLANLLVMSFYSVIAGWTLHYAWGAVSGDFAEFTPARAQDYLAALQGSLPRLLAWQGLFMLLTVVVVGLGVRRGIERSMRLMTPLMGVLLLGLVAHALVTGAGREALAYLFAPDFAAFTPQVILAGTGQALFSVSVGLGGIMMYASYLPESTSITRSAASVVAADTAVALLAGLAIFPVVFAHGLDPAGGPGLIFVTLPLAFAQMPGGAVIAAVFFVFLILAALTSAVALYEPATAYLRERGVPRTAGVLIAAAVSWALGLLSVLSFNLWADWEVTPFRFIAEGINTVILPLGVLAIVIFAGHILSREATVTALGLGEGRRYRAWRLAVRWLVPGFVLLLLISHLL